MPAQLTRRFGALLGAVLLIVAASPAAVGQAKAAAPTELFFSEYIEGSSNNKALEIYNGTGSAVDLDAGGYSIQMFFNGNTSPGLTLNLTGTVADGDVYVLAQSSADATILAQADQTNGSGWFNGDDAVVLRMGTTVLDVIGQIGVDPGSEWGTGLTSTADNTLRRMATVCAGDPDGANAFDPSLEWDGYATNTFDGLGAHSATCGAPPTVTPVINEFSASTTGTDVEFVEILGAPSADYSALTVLEIEGDSAGAGVIDEVIALGTSDTGGFFLVNLPANALENGTITLLLVENFTGALNTDLDTDNDGVFDATPWDAIVDGVAVNDGGAGDLTYGVPVLGPNYDGISSFAPGGASRIPDGMDTDAASDWVRNDFDLAGIPGYTGTLGPGEALNTPGAPNEIYVAPPEACGDSYTAIHDIQGGGDSSPVVGTEVATEGVIVGDFQNNSSPDNGNLNGFHIQVADGLADADPATSEGIFVYAPSAPDLSVGDAVRVRGTVAEYFGLTEISPTTQVWLCDTAQPVPTATSLSLPVAALADFEPVEGMLVTFPQPLVISEYFNFDRYGEIVLTSERQYQPTAVHDPGSTEAAALAAANILDRITLDDGRTNQNPDPAIHPNGSIFDLTNRFRGGDTVAGVTGVMDYSFNLYRIQPTAGATYADANPRPDDPEDVGGRLQVASMNALNYFLTIDASGSICGPAQDVECRGADTPEELDRQRAKLLAAIAGFDADVVGLIELENTPGVDAAADLASGLNDLLGVGTYAALDTGVIGTDAIRAGVLYRPASVTPVADFQTLDSADDPRFIDTKNRPTLAQTFQENATGARFTVAVNHLKSKGSACDDVGDPDLGDGAGNCNLTRTAAAEALVDWLATDPTSSGDPDFLILGDLNSYTLEDPIDAMLAGPDDTFGTSDDYTNLIARFQGADAYSYLFDGQLGYLDYAIASASMTGQVTGAADWHINADEPDLLDYDTTFKLPAQDALYEPNAYRSSDHDPLVIGLDPLASEGFATGGGTFVLGGDKVSFGFSVKGNRKNAEIKGSFNAVRHHPDGTISQLKGDAFGGLAILEAGGCGIATFNGTATYLTWDPTANGGLGAYVSSSGHPFTVRADDCGTPGNGNDAIWIDGPGDIDMAGPASANLAPLTGGNIVAPHTSGKK